jgi:hypothetical protein
LLIIKGLPIFCLLAHALQSFNASMGICLLLIFEEEKIMATINDFKNTQELTRYHESLRMHCRGDNNQLTETLSYALQSAAKNDNQQDASFGFVLGYN